MQTGAGLKPDVPAKNDPKTPADDALRTGLDAAARKAGCRRPVT